MEPEILWEDTHMVAVYKPSGLVVHPDGKTEEKTVCDWFVSKYPQAKEVGESIELTSGGVILRPGIVHRLDRETSGILLLAKTKEGHAHVKKQFQDRTIEKTYRTFVYGKVKADSGTIDRPIARSKSDFRKWSAQRGARGQAREAVTDYLVLKRSDDATFLDVKPKTGRTHQIRVHLKAINHPVVCDTLYAPNMQSILGFKRLALHAFSITFKDLEEKQVYIEAPYPDDFRQALFNIEKA